MESSCSSQTIHYRQSQSVRADRFREDMLGFLIVQCPKGRKQTGRYALHCIAASAAQRIYTPLTVEMLKIGRAHV